MSKTYMYVSSWNEFVGTPGIGLLEYNPENGDMTKIADLEETLTCNCTALDKKRNILYITNEIKENPDYVKGGGGLIYAYKIDPATGYLTQISRVPACCPCPAYISLDPTGRYLVCANHSSFFAVTKAVQKEDGTWGMEVVYDDATVDLFELNEDGTIGALVDVSKHTGRKEAFILHSHPHSAIWDPSGRFFACCDKGDDHIYMYRIDYAAKKLVKMCEPYHDAENSCPRYCVFHPAKPFFFANHERAINVSAFRYDEGGHLTHINTVNSIPEGFPLPEIKGFLPGQKPGQQGMAISADGKYIYNVINGNGADAVSVFQVDQETGAIAQIQFLRVEGKWARGCALSPDGRFLIVSCLTRTAPCCPSGSRTMEPWRPQASGPAFPAAPTSLSTRRTEHLRKKRDRQIRSRFLHQCIIRYNSSTGTCFKHENIPLYRHDPPTFPRSTPCAFFRRPLCN